MMEPLSPGTKLDRSGVHVSRFTPVLFFIECAGCKCQTPATDNQGVPDIPAHWFALRPESRPDYELYACSSECSHRTGYALRLSYPEDSILERRVAAEVGP